MNAKECSFIREIIKLQSWAEKGSNAFIAGDLT